MTSLHIRGLTKTFGNLTAVNNVNIDIPEGKLVCMLGPSGCGKTTLLRLIAGLEEKTDGEFLVGGEDYTNVPAHKRNFGMVFQSLALFPHLSVAENIEYPLKIQRVKKNERDIRIKELLELVKLPGIEDRQIHHLSGGQRQRVAIARGLATNPKIFLLDEPLSALDANLREHMQIEFSMLQQSLGVTTIVVTHDQREAMSIADLVIVMKNGEVQQIGTPINIYRNPANSFVANFIGSSNLLPCKLINTNSIDVNGHPVDLTEQDIVKISIGEAGVLSIRPEDIVISEYNISTGITAKIEFIRDLGASVEIKARIGEQEILSTCTPKRRPDIKIGDLVSINFHMGRATVMSS